MKVTTLGVIQALKSLGLWLGTYTVAGIKANPQQFLLAFTVYALISIPSDIYLLNKAHESETTSEGE